MAASKSTSAPRARGDGPKHHHPSMTSLSCSPRTRGWSPRSILRDPTHAVLPAHAGMVRQAPIGRRAVRRAPRARGDGPGRDVDPGHPRPCSPRTRGWSHWFTITHSAFDVLPAHAGMVRPGDHGRAGEHRAPHAGMVPCCPGSWRVLSRAPRARGDGPAPISMVSADTACSPRTRGWSDAVEADDIVDVVLPAHAGMVPGDRRPSSSRRRAPRARGDGPSAPIVFQITG